MMIFEGGGRGGLVDPYQFHHRKYDFPRGNEKLQAQIKYWHDGLPRPFGQLQRTEHHRQYSPDCTRRGGGLTAEEKLGVINF
jgi:hypothetical protein